VIADSHVQNYQKNGITANERGTTTVINGNTVFGQGRTTGAAENGIQIGFGARARVTSNTVADDVFAPDTIADPGDAATGILVFASPNVTISRNTIGNTQFGISLVSDPVAGSANGGAITMNQISATHVFDGIDLCSSSNQVRNNSINGSEEAGIHIDSSCGAVSGNRLQANSVNGACAAVLVGTAADGGNVVAASNAFFNDQFNILKADECTRPVGTDQSLTLKVDELTTTLNIHEPTTTAKRPKYQPARP
jgi:hypothetical protein